jgi:glucokinase
MHSYVVGVDLGGTQVRAVLSDATGQIYKRVATATKADEGQDAVIGRIKALMDQVWPKPDVGVVKAIGLSAPGPLDPTPGVIVFAPNLPGWEMVPLRNIIAGAYGVPTFLGNDANLAALAENRFGAGRDMSDMIYITVSTGVGGGIISHGEMLLGSHGFAAEVGHMTVEAQGIRCLCGNTGCLESYASGPSIARHAVEGLRKGATSMVTDLVAGDLGRITAKELHDAARAGDAFAQAEFRRAGFYLGVGITSLLHLFNPRMIVLGGSVSKAGTMLTDAIWETVRARAPRQYWEGLSIVPAALGDDVVLIGAVALAEAESHRQKQTMVRT